MATDPETGEWIDDDQAGYADTPTPEFGGGAPAPAAEAPKTDSQPQSLKGSLGDLWTQGADDEWARHDYDKDWGSRITNKENLRADNEVGSDYNEDGKGGYLTGPAKPGGSKMFGAGGNGYDVNGFDGKTPWGGDLMSALKGLFPGGAFNQDIVNRRTDNARGTLEAQRKSSMKNNEAYLAERGLIGSGPQADAANSLESRLFGQFGQAQNDIFANESENADKRMIAALQAATGVNADEAANAVRQYSAATERGLGDKNIGLGYYKAGNDYELGRGNLALGNMNATNEYNLGAGRLGLDQQKLIQDFYEHADDATKAIIDQLFSGAVQSGNGYTKR